MKSTRNIHATSPSVFPKLVVEVETDAIFIMKKDSSLYCVSEGGCRSIGDSFDKGRHEGLRDYPGSVTLFGSK